MNLLEALVEGGQFGIERLTCGDVVLMSEHLQTGPAFMLLLYDKPIVPGMIPATNPTTAPIEVDSIGAVLATLIRTGRREIAFGDNWQHVTYMNPVFRIDPHQSN